MKRFGSIFLALFLLLLLFLISEFIFNYKNRPSELAVIFLSRAETEIKRGGLDAAMSKLDKAAYFHLKQNRIYYKDKLPKSPDENLLTGLDEDTRNEVSDYLKGSILKARVKNSELILSNIYYNLGLITYSHGYKEPSFKLFRTSIYLNPELGFLFIELANSYFYNGYFEEGVQTLNYCQEFEFPRQYCKEYLENNVKSNSLDPVGTFREIIPKYQGLAD